jgi:hypothetical protein
MPPVKCPSCGAEVQPEDLVCVTCGANLTRAHPGDSDRPSPPTIMHERIRLEDVRSVAPPGPVETCPSCGAPVTDPQSGVCARCGRPLRHPPTVTSLVVLRLAFATGNVDIPAGTSLLLGRDPEESLVAAAFARFEDVSRRHATVTVHDTGRATVRDEYSTNGTFVRGDRVLPGTDVALADGDTLRLAAEAAAKVHLPSPLREPEPLDDGEAS